MWVQLMSFLAPNISAYDNPKSIWGTRLSRGSKPATRKSSLQQCDSETIRPNRLRHSNSSEQVQQEVLIRQEHSLSESRSLKVKAEEVENQGIFTGSQTDFLR